MNEYNNKVGMMWSATAVSLLFATLAVFLDAQPAAEFYMTAPKIITYHDYPVEVHRDSTFKADFQEVSNALNDMSRQKESDNKEIEKLRKELKEKDAMIGNLKKDLNLSINTVANMAAQIDEQKKWNEDLKKQLDDQSKVVEELQRKNWQQIDSAAREVSRLKKEAMRFQDDPRVQKILEKATIESLLKRIFGEVYGQNQVKQMENGLKKALSKYEKKNLLFEQKERRQERTMLHPSQEVASRLMHGDCALTSAYFKGQRFSVSPEETSNSNDSVIAYIGQNGITQYGVITAIIRRSQGEMDVIVTSITCVPDHTNQLVMRLVTAGYDRQKAADFGRIFPQTLPDLHWGVGIGNGSQS